MTRAAQLFAIQAAGKRLELGLAVAPAVPPWLLGDPTRLRQIVTNLIGNALKFTERGSVAVSASLDPADGAGVALHLRVADTGIGIAADKCAQIFDAFTQADGSTTRRFGGTGLGLTISATLVALMGGRIWVDSEPGAGSTFHVVLPFDVADRGAEEPVAPPAAPPAPLRAVRILVVEDNVVNQRVAAGLLGRRGHDVTLAHDGAEALDRLGRGTFDVVLMDLQMPMMSGIEATAAIRARERAGGGHVRIVAMTAHAMAGDRERCLSAGMDGYLSKPIEPQKLFAAVEQQPAACPFDAAELLARLCGDTGLMADVIAAFLEDCPARLAAIERPGRVACRGAARRGARAQRQCREPLGHRPVRCRAGARTDHRGDAPRHAGRRVASRVDRSHPSHEGPAGPHRGEGAALMRILIADDDRMSTMMLSRSLERWGFEVVVAHDGVSAWGHIDGRTPPALAIVDWMMPGIDGLELCRRIREAQLATPVYVILLTSRNSRQDLVAGLEAGADDYLTKPFDPDELRARIHVGQRTRRSSPTSSGSAACCRSAATASASAPIRTTGSRSKATSPSIPTRSFRTASVPPASTRSSTTSSCRSPIQRPP